MPRSGRRARLRPYIRRSTHTEGASMAAAISRDEVAHLARLSRLAVSEEELDTFAGQLDIVIAGARPPILAPTGF